MEAYVRHESGEIYAVQYDDDGKVLGVIGPLHYTECTAQNLPDFEYVAEDTEWMESEMEAGRVWQQ